MSTQIDRTIEKSVSVKDIASRCGVSTSTVSCALRGGNGEVGEETRQRIVATAKAMGYDPSRNQAARRMSQRRHGAVSKCYSIGMTLAGGQSLHHSYVGYLLEGVTDELSLRGFGLNLTPVIGFEEFLPVAWRSGDIDGLLVVYPAAWFANYETRLRAEPHFGNKPIVMLVEPLPTSSCVRADDFQAGYLAASHLLSLGHRHIIHKFVPGQEVIWGGAVCPNGVSSLRLQGMYQAYREIGLNLDDFATVIDVPHNPSDSCERSVALVQTLRDHPEITAIVAPNDLSATLIWNVLCKAGFRIPEDISIVSFDDTDPIVADKGENVLTTVRIPLDEIGRQGARLMLRTIDEDDSTVQNIVLPTELIVRGSTSAPKR